MSKEENVIKYYVLCNQLKNVIRTGWKDWHVKKERLEVPIWHKPYLTIDEATAYTGIGREKLREMTRFADCPFVLWVGKRRMIKRELFDEYIEKMYEI